MKKRLIPIQVKHKVLLSDEKKKEFFDFLIKERQSVQPFETLEDVKEFITACRKIFNSVYCRDVTGDFIKKRLSSYGIDVSTLESTKLKFDFAFNLMNKNNHFRYNKTSLRKALEKQFNEKTLNTIVDEIWEKYHSQSNKPEPVEDIDIHHVKNLF